MANAHIKRIPSVCECKDHAFVNLTKWGVALVSKEDAWLLLDRNWNITASPKNRLAYATSLGFGMHRAVTECPAGEIVDHRNHNGLDNRRPNLRIASASNNQWNKREQRGKKSKYKGVRFSKFLSGGVPYWKAAIYLDGKNHILGHFTDEIEAAKTYDKAAIKHFGEYAATNATLGLLEGPL